MLVTFIVFNSRLIYKLLIVFTTNKTTNFQTFADTWPCCSTDKATEKSCLKKANNKKANLYCQSRKTALKKEFHLGRNTFF